MNPHRLFSFFWSSKNICSLSSSAPTLAKIAQFGKGKGKIWGVWCKGGSMLGDG